MAPTATRPRNENPPVQSDPEPEDEDEDEDEDEETEGSSRVSHFSRPVKISVRAHDSASALPDVGKAIRDWANSRDYAVHVKENESGTSYTIFSHAAYAAYKARGGEANRIPRINRTIFADPRLQTFIENQRSQGASDEDIQNMLIERIFG